ncbi:MAG: hypothetical protein K2G08_08280 [Paramuribaculum sp.]|nr:hypothetical protein [Paramuribaculum sp.]
MKNTVKTITLTLDELRKIMVDSASGLLEEANNFVAFKIKEKAERLELQRERRRQRKEQQKAAAKSSTTSRFSENSENSEHSESSENSPEKVALPLNKELAKCILWINNRREAMKANISRIVREIALSGGRASSLAAIESALKLLLRIAKEASQAAHDHLHSKYRLRPASAMITL